MKPIIIIPDTDHGFPDGTMDDLCEFASFLSEGTGNPVKCLLASSTSEENARAVSHAYGIDCVVLVGPALGSYSAEGYTAAIVRYCGEHAPSFVCVPHTSCGCDFAPALAVRLNASCVSGVHNAKLIGGIPVFTRSAGHGKIETDIEVTRDTAVVTVMRGSFQKNVRRRSENPSVTVFRADMTLTRTRSSTLRDGKHADTGLDRADVVVSAGRGVGTHGRMELVHELASLLPRAAVGGSRIACDMGLVNYSGQVGMTGRTVAPKLYIACGISGSLQHIAGMKHSRRIVAINRDPDAPIFSISDAGVVENIEDFLPLLIDELKRRG